jgi:hypothetical protein
MLKQLTFYVKNDRKQGTMSKIPKLALFTSIAIVSLLVTVIYPAIATENACEKKCGNEFWSYSKEYQECTSGCFNFTTKKPHTIWGCPTGEPLCGSSPLPRNPCYGGSSQCVNPFGKSLQQQLTIPYTQ